MRIRMFTIRNINDFWLDVIAGTPYRAEAKTSVSMDVDTAFFDGSLSVGKYFSIDFGDGSPLFVTKTPETRIVEHAYKTGVYIATATAYDGKLTDALTKQIVISVAETLEFGSTLDDFSRLAAQFRAKYASEPATYEGDLGKRLIHVSPMDTSTRKLVIEEYNWFLDSEIFICFTSEFMLDGEFRPPKRGDKLIKRALVGVQEYTVTATADGPAWAWYNADPGQRVFLLNTRRKP